MMKIAQALAALSVTALAENSFGAEPAAALEPAPLSLGAGFSATLGELATNRIDGLSKFDQLKLRRSNELTQVEGITARIRAGLKDVPPPPNAPKQKPIDVIAFFERLSENVGAPRRIDAPFIDGTIAAETRPKLVTGDLAHVALWNGLFQMSAEIREGHGPNKQFA